MIHIQKSNEGIDIPRKILPVLISLLIFTLTVEK